MAAPTKLAEALAKVLAVLGQLPVLRCRHAPFMGLPDRRRRRRCLPPPVACCSLLTPLQTAFTTPTPHPQVDELLEALKAGTLLASGPASQPAAAAPPAAAKPAAAAPKPAAPAAAAPAAAPKQGKKDKAASKKENGGGGAPAAAEGDALSKAHLAVRAAPAVLFECLACLKPPPCWLSRWRAGHACTTVLAEASARRGQAQRSRWPLTGLPPHAPLGLPQVGRVVSVSDHPSGSEKLWLCQVDVGGGAQRQVRPQPSVLPALLCCGVQHACATGCLLL